MKIKNFEVDKEKLVSIGALTLSVGAAILKGIVDDNKAKKDKENLKLEILNELSIKNEEA